MTLNQKSSALLTTIYTLTPTHCGTGQASGAIDLPIAREATTRLPILPATSLKGVARAAFKAAKVAEADLAWLFGGELERQEPPARKSEADETRTEKRKEPPAAGTLILGEGHLLVYPFRALGRPLVFGTCRLLLERFGRLARAHGLTDPRVSDITKAAQPLASAKPNVLLLQKSPSGPVVIEDRVYRTSDVVAETQVGDLGKAMAKLLPAEEEASRKRLEADLVVLPDNDFIQLIQRVTPVSARIKLTSGKTTSKYFDAESEEEESGNLWYEEVLPADCLFFAIVSERIGAKPPKGSSTSAAYRFQKPGTPIGEHPLGAVQIGGNETVGHGLCWWHVGGA